ncbi:unnamed protein product, partial [marine sediment metagenome]
MATKVSMFPAGLKRRTVARVAVVSALLGIGVAEAAGLLLAG